MVAADKAHSEKRREYSRTPVLRFCTSRVSVPDWKGALRAVRVHVPSQRSGKGRTLPLDLGTANGRIRRNLVVAAHSGEGLLTIRFADLRHRALQNRCLLRSRGHALASRLRASWMEARGSTVEDFSTSDRHLRFLRSTDIPRFPELLVCRHPICRCDRVCMSRRWRNMDSSHRSP
jgi:hypothetical protein